MLLNSKDCFDFAHDGIQHEVYFVGSGPAVLLLHEINGMNPAFCRTAARIADSGFTVFAPLFFGKLNEKVSVARGLLTVMCVRREFDLLQSKGKSRSAEWLRALSRNANTRTGNRGVGVIGMCLTGNVVLSMMLEECVKVPVMCEPSLPFLHPHSLGVPDSDLQVAVKRSLQTPVSAYRFSQDKICPRERFVTLRSTFPAKGLHATEIRSGVNGIPKDAHSVLTGEYPGQDDPNHPVQHVLDEILMAFKTRLISDAKS